MVAVICFLILVAVIGFIFIAMPNNPTVDSWFNKKDSPSRGDLRIVEYKDDSGTEYYRIEISDLTGYSYIDLRPYWKELDFKRYASVSDAMDAMEKHRRLTENRNHYEVIYTTKEA